MILSLPIAKHRANIMVFNRFSKFCKDIYMDTIANKKKTRLLDLRSSARSLSRRSSCSANNHDISGKLKHFACFTCLLLFCENSYFEVNSMTEKFNSVSPKLLSPLSFYYNQEPFMRKSYLRAGENVHALLIHS